MKTIQVLTMMLAGAMLAATPLRAENPATATAPAKEPAKEMKCVPKKEDEAKKPMMEKMKQGMEAKMEAMKAKEKAEAAEFDKLFDAMNSSVGDKKIEAIAAILNKMAQKEKAMKAKCEAMMKDMMKKDGKTDAKPGELDYYTCTMHPAVHWPVPGKCPICAMDLVPVFKKDAGAKPGEEPKKAADPHAAHH
jgi:hypothetical protein